MSEGARMPLELAQEAAARLMERWAMDPGTCSVVGSVRRRGPDVEDIELCAPCPVEGEADALFRRISADVVPAAAGGQMLLGLGVGGATRGREVEGLKLRFRHARLVIKFWVREGGPTAYLPVEVYRYDPGPQGNRGWIELLRTGPREFGLAFLAYWRGLMKLPERQKTSIDGYLRDADGAPVPAPDEPHLFDRAGLGWLEPWDRHGAADLERSASVWAGR